MPSFNRFLLLSLPILLLVSLSLVNAHGHEISSGQIIQLLKCHLRYKFQKTEIPPLSGEKNETNFKAYMDKYFGIELAMKKCFEELEKSTGLWNLKEALFSDDSNFGKWSITVKKIMRHEFSKIGVEQATNDHGKPAFDKLKKTDFRFWFQWLIPCGWKPKGKPKFKDFRFWNRMLIPYGILTETFYSKFVKVLLDGLLETMQNKGMPESLDKYSQLVDTLKWYSRRIGHECENNINIVKYSFLKHFLQNKTPDLTTNDDLVPGKYTPDLSTINDLVKDRYKDIQFELDDIKTLEFQMPKVKRTIWLIRHAQRHDNVNKTKNHYLTKTEDGREFEPDNSPLSPHGQQMAKNMQPLIAAIPVKYFYASPYERTVDTAHLILGKSHPNVQIRLEPGLVESLHRCYTKSGNPSFLGIEQLENHAYYKRIDKDYVPIYNKEMLVDTCKPNELKDKEKDHACIERVQDMFEKLLNREDGHEETQAAVEKSTTVPTVEITEEMKGKLLKELIAPNEQHSEHTVIVSHGTVLLSAQLVFDGKYQYIPQLSISKVIELDENYLGSLVDPKDDKKEIAEIRAETSNSNPLQNFHQFFASESRYVADLNAFNDKKKVEDLFQH